MASSTKQGASMLGGFVRRTRFDTGLGIKNKENKFDFINSKKI